MIAYQVYTSMAIIVFFLQIDRQEVRLQSDSFVWECGQEEEG